MRTKQEFVELLEYLTPEQIDFLYRLINTMSSGMISKGDIMKLNGMSESHKIDTAMPCDYVKRIQEVLPGFKTFRHVFDYRKQTFGEITNVNDELVDKIISLFNK